MPQECLRDLGAGVADKSLPVCRQRTSSVLSVQICVNLWEGSLVLASGERSLKHTTPGAAPPR